MGCVDWYLPNENLIIEYYGVYWHCKPSIYESTYYHKNKKKFADEIWDDDNKRNLYILKKIPNCSILIIWEDTNMSAEYLFKLINEIKNTKAIIEI